VRLSFNPLDEPLHVGVGFEGLECVVLPFELLVWNLDVYVPMTGSTELYRTVHLLTMEHLLISLILVARPGNEVVPGQPLHRASAEPARSTLHLHAAVVLLTLLS
jgi:hypothetical protein